MSTSDHLSRIESTGLIQLAQLEPELEYIFRHALIQDAAYSMLVKEQRRTVHSAVAHAIESLYPDRLTELAPQLAHHFGGAGELEKALSYATTAAEQAASRYANAEASIYFARAIDLAGQLQASRDVLIKLYEGQGRVYQLSGKHEDALTTYLGLELVARERGDRALELHALMEQSTVYAMLTQQANPQESIRLSENALVIAREIKEEAAEAKILWNLSLAHWNMDMDIDMTDAIKFAEQSLEISRRLNLREQLAYTLHDLGRYYMLDGQFEQAIAAQRDAEALWRELINRPMLADSLNLKANLLYHEDDMVGARASSEEAFQISRDAGNAWGQAMSLQGLGMASLEQGELGRSLEESRVAIPLSDQAGFRLGSMANRARAIEIYAYLGGIKSAKMALEEVSRSESLSSLPIVQNTLAFWYATFEFQAGNSDPMRNLLEKFRDLPRQTSTDVMTYYDLRQAILAHHLGEHELIIAIVEPLKLKGVSGLQMLSSALSHMARLQGVAFMRLGRLKEARDSFDTAHELVGHEHTHYQRWVLFAAMAELDDLEGNVDSAKKHRAQAVEEVEYLAIRVNDPYLEATFRARPDVAALLASG